MSRTITAEQLIETLPGTIGKVYVKDICAAGGEEPDLSSMTVDGMIDFVEWAERLNALMMDGI